MTELQFIDLGLSSADVMSCVFHTAEKTGDKTLSIVPDFVHYNCDVEPE
jgi:hypothetical protein